MMTHFIELLFSHASFKGPGILKVEGPLFIVVPVAIAMVWVSIGSIVWLYKDALDRSRSGWLAVLFILATGWPVSFLWWFWLRPPLSLRPSDQNRFTA